MKKVFILFACFCLLLGCGCAEKMGAQVSLNQSFHFIYVNIVKTAPIESGISDQMQSGIEKSTTNQYKTYFQASTFQFNPDGSFIQKNDSDGSARANGTYRYDGKTLLIDGEIGNLPFKEEKMSYSIDGTKFTIQYTTNYYKASAIFRSDLPTTK